MSKATIGQVIQRAVSDAAFRRQLQRDPGKALAGFDLTKEERAAITSGDPVRLTALGVDQRMSKAFGLSALGDVSKTVAADASGVSGVSAHAAFLDEGTLTGPSASSALVSPDAAAGGNAALIGVDGQAGTAMFDAGSGTAGTAGIVGDPTAAASAAIDSSAPSHLQRVEADLDAPNMRGAVEGTTPSNLQRIEADLDAPNMRSAFEPTDASGGTGALTDEVGNTIDPGVTSTDPSVDAAFDADAGSGGASGGSHIQ